MRRSAMSLREVERQLRAQPIAAVTPAAPAKSSRASQTVQSAGKAGGESVGSVRIVGGEWRRRKLPVAVRPGLRPTPDRVRETLFNWLGQDLGGWRCADVFAGTGALGFEAASRGAAKVLMVESDTTLVAQLQKVCEMLDARQVQVVRGDGPQVLLRSVPGSLDLVLIDPPFSEGPLFEAAIKAAAQAVAPAGWVYLESPQAWSVEQLAAYGFVATRTLKAGAVHAHLLQRMATESTNSD